MSIRYERIPGFSRYVVSNNGYVFSLNKLKNNKGYGKKIKHQMKIYYNKQGYGTVNLVDDSGKQHTMRVHRLVAEAFCEKPIGYNVVHHLNEDTLDNRAENLLWVNPILHEKIHHDKI